MLRRLVALLLCLALVAAACSSDDDGGSAAEGDDASSGTDVSDTTDEPDTTTDGADTGDGPEVTDPPGSTDGSDGEETDAEPDGGEPSGEAQGIYGDLEVWMCHPDKPAEDDLCRGAELDATSVAPDGTLTPVAFEPATETDADCFYIYPTASEDASVNSDLIVGSEGGTTSAQAGRYAEACAVWAPIYRQITVPALFDPALREGRTEGAELAYDDVVDAWNTYLATADPDRGVVLFGHSQGASVLSRLIAEEIDTDPEARDRLISAHLMGTSFQVPPGEVVGGDLDNIPLCTAAEEHGCVVTFSSYRDTEPPDDAAIFGRGGDTTDAGCVSPAELLGRDTLTSFVNQSTGLADPEAEVPTRWVTTPGLVSGECVSNEFATYLELSNNADPSDPRADDLGGDFRPGWGMHLIDMQVTLGDLVDLTSAQIESYLAG